MVKKIAIALLCTALGTSLYARDDISQSNLFIGLELESTKADSTAQLFVDNTPIYPEIGATSSSVTEYGLRLGAEKDDWRTTLLYTYYNEEEEGIDETMHKGSILLDYFIWSSRSTDYNVKPYIGAHVGYMSYELTGDIGYGVSATIADDTGIFYGGQAGIAMTILEVVQIDISYKYSLTTLDDISIPVASNANVVGNLDNMRSIAFSINYFY